MNAQSRSDQPARTEPNDKRSPFRLARVQQFELVEVRQVAAEVLKRMKELQPGADDKHKAWVAAEFQYPLRSLLIKAAGNSISFAAISMVVVAGGFATSGIAVAAGADKGSLAAWIVFAIGLIVAMAGGIAQIFRFGVRSNKRRTLAITLREEGWNFVYKEGEYTNDGDALQKFRARVNEVQRRVADVASIESEGQPGTLPGTDHKPDTDPEIQPSQKAQNGPTSAGAPPPPPKVDQDG